MRFPPGKTRVSFKEFMEYSLYDPEAGYYSGGRQVFGPQGDYFTSAYTHPIFARLLARQLAQEDQLLGSPKQFDLIELGAGEGILAAQLRESLTQEHPELAERTHYVGVEVGAPELPESITGVVFSNEFFDALPVHRVRFVQGRLDEIFVQLEGTTLTEVAGPLSDPRIQEYMRLGFTSPREGWIYEVNLGVLDWLKRLDEKIRRGVVLTLDYGFEDGEYAESARPAGTLLCYRHHEALPDPYQHVGEQDMTAHVNFSVLQAVGEHYRWHSDSLRSQRKVLMDLGLEELLLEEERLGILSDQRVPDRLQLRQLLEPDGISDAIQLLRQTVRIGSGS